MSYNKEKKIKINSKNDFLLSKKKESPNLFDNLQREHSLEPKICQFCNNNDNLIQCIKCNNYYCLECIKQINYLQQIGENEYICQSCNKQEKSQKKKIKFFCFICGDIIKGKKNYNYLLNNIQKVDFKYNFLNRRIILSKEGEEIINKDGDSNIRICMICHIKYFYLIDNIMNKNSEKKKKNYIFEDNTNYIPKKKYDDKSQEKSKEINISENIKNDDNKQCIYNDLNISNLEKNNNNSISNNNNNNLNLDDLYNNLNLCNNIDVLNLNNNKLIIPNINNNLNIINDLNKKINSNSLNILLNLINNYSNFLIPNLELNNNINNFNILNKNNFLNSNLGNIFDNTNNFNNLNENNNHEKIKFNNQDSNEKIKKIKKKGNIENTFKDSSVLKEDNIYFFLYKLKDALWKFTKYVNFFEINNIYYNNSIISNIEAFSDIFEKIIDKLENDIKKNITTNNIDNLDNNNKNIGSESGNYNYYIKNILYVNESFKNKVNILRAYSDLKNQFLLILFKNIERLILKLSEFLSEEKVDEENETNKKNDNKNLNLLNQNSINQFNNTPQIKKNLNNNNIIFHNNIDNDNQYEPCLFDKSNYNSNNNQSFPLSNLPQITYNNINNNNMSVINNPELNFPHNINNNLQFELDHQQKLFNENPFLINKAFIDNYANNIKYY